MFLMPEAATDMAGIFIILTTISVVYGAFGALAQKDLKYINAYSSVSHCGLVLFALLMMNKTAMDGAIIQMISHGLVTALFFALIGMIYGRTHTRMIDEMGGLMKVIPFLSVIYVIAGLASLGLPGLSGFVAEMTIFVGAFQHPDTWHRVAIIIATTSIVVTAVYILRVVGKMLFGQIMEKEYLEYPDAKWYEKISVVVLIHAALGEREAGDFIEEHAQLADLRVAVDPLAVHIPARLGKAVPALPDPPATKTLPSRRSVAV